MKRPVSGILSEVISSRLSKKHTIMSRSRDPLILKTPGKLSLFDPTGAIAGFLVLDGIFNSRSVDIFTEDCISALNRKADLRKSPHTSVPSKMNETSYPIMVLKARFLSIELRELYVIIFT